MPGRHPCRDADSCRARLLPGRQNSPRVAILEQDGWAAIKAGKGPAATEAFREAIKLDPKNASLRLGAGTAEFLQRHDAEAKALLEQALDLDPKLTRARAQLAQVVKRQGDLQEAIRLYEIVAVEVPDDAAVRETLRALEARARSARSHAPRSRRSLHRVVRGRRGCGDGRAGARIAQPRVLADQRRVRRLSAAIGAGRALQRRAVSRHHPVAAMGGGGVRRHHPRADARRRRKGRGPGSRARARILARADSLAGHARLADVAERGPRVGARERQPRLGRRPSGEGTDGCRR